MLSCTHLVLYVRDIGATRDFYVGALGCSERRYAPDEDFLSVLAGGFILNFYGPKLSPPLADGYSGGVCHVGLEAATKEEVHAYFERLSGEHTLLDSKKQPLRSVAALEARQTPGPYRFYVRDPDGYVLEVHTWEGGVE